MCPQNLFYLLKRVFPALQCKTPELVYFILEETTIELEQKLMSPDSLLVFFLVGIVAFIYRLRTMKAIV